MAMHWGGAEALRFTGPSWHANCFASIRHAKLVDCPLARELLDKQVACQSIRMPIGTRIALTRTHNLIIPDASWHSECLFSNCGANGTAIANLNTHFPLAMPAEK